MGSYTQYYLKIRTNEKIEQEELSKQFEGITKMDVERLGDEPIRWYNYDSDMKELSLKYPKAIFELTLIGEERGDNKRAYFKNGKVDLVNATIVYPPFDESRLS